MLAEHPEINVLLAFNEPTSVGAADAVEGMGLAEEVFLVGFDSNVATIDGLQDGTVDALIVQNPYAMGYLGVESAYRLLSGQGGSPEATVDTSTRIVNRDNMFTMDSQKPFLPLNSPFFCVFCTNCSPLISSYCHVWIKFCPSFGEISPCFYTSFP